MADLRSKGPRLRLGHLWVGELQHWHLCPPCIALDLAVQFKLLSGIRPWTQLSSSGPHCTKWDDNRQGSTFRLGSTFPDLPFPKLWVVMPWQTWCRKAPGFGWANFRWVSYSINKQYPPGRLEVEKPLASAEPPSGERAAALTTLSPLYSTGPRCPF